MSAKLTKNFSEDIKSLLPIDTTWQTTCKKNLVEKRYFEKLLSALLWNCKQYIATIKWVEVTFISSWPQFDFWDLWLAFPNKAGMEIWKAHVSHFSHLANF